MELPLDLEIWHGVAVATLIFGWRGRSTAKSSACGHVSMWGWSVARSGALDQNHGLTPYTNITLDLAKRLAPSCSSGPQGWKAEHHWPRAAVLDLFGFEAPLRNSYSLLCFDNVKIRVILQLQRAQKEQTMWECFWFYGFLLGIYLVQEFVRLTVHTVWHLTAPLKCSHSIPLLRHQDHGWQSFCSWHLKTKGLKIISHLEKPFIGIGKYYFRWECITGIVFVDYN